MVGSVSDSVRVTARILPAGVARREFGNTLFLAYEAASVNTRNAAVLLRTVRTYPDLDALEADNHPAGVEDAAGIYFQQVPFPKAMLVGYTIGAAQPGLIFGVEPGTVADIAALGAATSLTLDGTDIAVDLNGVTTYADVATQMQTGVRTVTAHSSATVTADADGILTLESTASFGTGFVSSTASNLLGVADGATILEPVATAEAPGDALSRIADEDCNFFGVGVAPTIAEDYTMLDSARDWVAARRLSFLGMFDVYGQDVLTTGETTSTGALLYAQGGDGIAAVYNGLTASAIDHKALSYMARFSSINYDRPNAVINGKFLDLPGTIPTALTATQKAELERKRINYYEPVARGVGGDTQEGTTSGTWIDVYVWLSWFKDALEVEAYNLLKQSAGIGGIPITDQGLGAVADALESVCERGVSNGGLAPNFVSPALRLAIQRATGNADFDGFLSTGYLVHRPRAADVDQTLRNSRGPIPISIFAKGSGKVNSLDISVVFEN